MAVCCSVNAIAQEPPDTGRDMTYIGSLGEDLDDEPADTQTRYADNGDGTVTDTVTGLMWVQDGGSAGCNNGAALTWAKALSFCEDLIYAGHSDWRLPARKELEGIVDYGTSSPAINTEFFTNTSTRYYWTATTYNPDYANSGLAWLVSFFGGGVYGTDKTNKNLVRCVREVSGDPSSGKPGESRPETEERRAAGQALIILNRKGKR